jgi:hypothetical protein
MALSILSPLSAPDEVERLIKAGADEFYCGILPKQWRQDYSVAASLNRRQEDNLKQNVIPHMTTFEELTRCVELAKPHNVNIAITLNEHFYSNNQYPFLTNYIEQCLKSGADTFIVGDIGMILTLQDIDPGVNIHISTAEAYSGIRCKERPDSIKNHLTTKTKDWHKHFYNDFEEALFEKYTELKNIKKSFYEKGAVYAAMSGSGSAIYGLFHNTPPPLAGRFPFEWEGRLK